MQHVDADRTVLPVNMCVFVLFRGKTTVLVISTSVRWVYASVAVKEFSTIEKYGDKELVTDDKYQRRFDETDFCRRGMLNIGL